MALLRVENGSSISDVDKIRAELSPLGIELAEWPFERIPKISALLVADVLGDDQKEELLRAFDDRFEEQKNRYGYQARDLVVLHTHTPNLDGLLKIFDKCHTHADDEVRYIVDGSGIFGFVMPDGTQVLLTVKAGEYIRIPAKTEHWFVLDQHRRIKAVRYFTNKNGWVATYTGTNLRVRA